RLAVRLRYRHQQQLQSHRSRPVRGERVCRDASGSPERLQVRCSLQPQPALPGVRAPDGGSTACRLFVFDARSRSVRSDCGCLQRGRLFVKQRSGLTSGSLCPNSFGHGRCGVKYMAYSGSGNWEQSRLRCESEPGLVVMADAADLAELSHLDRVRSELLSPQTSVWLGGLQQPGSAEPSGGWTWVTCGHPVATKLWADGQPDNYNSDNAIAIFKDRPERLTDLPSSDSRATAVLCLPQSPTRSLARRNNQLVRLKLNQAMAQDPCLRPTEANA
uniref:C-type lectin domain-containing protein n=1 Tax=Macrostomum lignano TaxID=282301 RepID=A0A1I8GDI5_9PLAT